MEREGVAVIANEVPQALANINLKESEERFGPYLIMCLYTFSLLNLMKKPASVTGIKTGWITHSIVSTYLMIHGSQKRTLFSCYKLSGDGEYLWHSVQAVDT
jgi:hypothetical protein